MATTYVPRHPVPGPAPADPAAHPVSPLGSAITLLRFAAVMAAALAVVSLPGSSLFVISDVEVIGAHATPPAAIIARAGVRPGDRIAGISLSRVAQQVSSLPAIAQANVRIGPDGQVTIYVRERDPYAAVPFRGSYLILDRLGVVLESRGDPGKLPIVMEEGFAPAWVRLGDRLPSTRINQALRAVGELPPGITGPGTQIIADPRGEVILRTPDRIAVRLGPLRGIRERSAMLPALLDGVRARGLTVEYLDLRYAGTVVMKPAGGSPSAGKRP